MKLEYKIKTLARYCALAGH